MYFANYKELAHATEVLNSDSFADNYYLKLTVSESVAQLKEWQNLIKFLKNINFNFIKNIENSTR